MFTNAAPRDYVVFVLSKACDKMKVVENGQQIHAHIYGNRALESSAFSFNGHVVKMWYDRSSQRCIR